MQPPPRAMTPHAPTTLYMPLLLLGERRPYVHLLKKQVTLHMGGEISEKVVRPNNADKLLQPWEFPRLEGRCLSFAARRRVLLSVSNWEKLMSRFQGGAVRCRAARPSASFLLRCATARLTMPVGASCEMR